MGFYANIKPLKIVELTRKIHPVGQGAFYSESFKDNTGAVFSVVYDCGSFNRKRLAEEIKDFNNQVDHVDALFVSHFHFDHTCGITNLKDVREIYIPIVSPTRFIIDYIYNGLYSNEGGFEANEFMKRCLPSLTDSEQLSVKGISPIGAKSDFSEIRIGVNIPLWMYEVLYPEICSTKENELLQQLKNLPELGLILETIDKWKDAEIYERILRIIRENNLWDKIKRVYAEVFDGHNDYSMILHSHKADDVQVENPGISSCIFTGDAKITDVIGTIIENRNPDVIQIPHHGSGVNFYPNLYKKNQMAFVSVGESNIYNHPGKAAFNYVLNHCGQTWMVTDSKEPSFMQIVKLIK